MLQRVKSDTSRLIADGESRIYRASLRLRDGILYFIAAEGADKALYLCCPRSISTDFKGTASTVGGMHLFKAGFSAENARTLHALFPFTAPVSLRERTTTIGCGDRLGLATPGHVRAIAGYDASPVLAQQSIR